MAKAKQRPNLIELMNGLFRPWFSGESWNPWKSVIRGISVLPMSAVDTEFFADVAGGRAPPKKRPRESYFIIGRRGGKDSVASAIGACAFLDEQGFHGVDHRRPAKCANTH